MSLGPDLLSAIGAVCAIAALALYLVFLRAPAVAAIPTDTVGTTTNSSVVVSRWSWAESVDQGAVRWVRMVSVFVFADALCLAFAAGLLAASTQLGADLAVPAFLAMSLILLGLMVYIVRTARLYGGRWANLRVSDFRR